ncbi:MAG TPA: prephenate dehydratase [Leptolyngbyaceae cyanobacterium]
MTLSLAYLGPKGTYSEMAALTYSSWLQHRTGESISLQAYPSIAQALQATALGATALTITPVENSIEGSVTVTLDTLWQLDTLRIQNALVLPITHALISKATSLKDVEVVYSHPQALAQCQQWIEKNLSQAKVVPANSTTEALLHLSDNPSSAAVSSERAAKLYQLPILADEINDYADNCTKFWILGLTPNLHGGCTSLAFSLPVNAPGALLKPLEIFANHSINLSRIESRPTKRSLGDYLFFVDLEASANNQATQAALRELTPCTENLKTFGSYDFIPADFTASVKV